MPRTRSSALAMASSEAKVRLDLNNPVFQDKLLTLQKPERHAALDTLDKIRQLTWNQLYRNPVREVGEDQQRQATPGHRCNLLPAHHPGTPGDCVS